MDHKEVNIKLDEVDKGQSREELPSEAKWTTSFVCHLALFLIFFVSFVYSIVESIQRDRSIFFDYLFFTQWNLLLQLSLNGLGVMCAWNPQFVPRIAWFRDRFFHSIAFPCAFFVCTFFWGLVLYNEELVRLPPEERPQEWHNQVVHTLVVPSVLINEFATYYQLPSATESFTIIFFIVVIYSSFASYVGIFFEMWPYEIMRIYYEKSLFKLSLLYTVGFLASVAFICMGRKLHQLIWKRS